MPNPMTQDDVQKIINQTKSGSYNQDHDWSPDYSLEEKAVFLETLLKNWEITDEQGRKLILQFLRTLVQEAGNSAEVIAHKLISFAGIQEVNSAVLSLLNSGLFSLGILASLKKDAVNHREWMLKIKKLAQEKKFSESKNILKNNNLFHKIEILLLQYSE